MNLTLPVILGLLGLVFSSKSFIRRYARLSKGQGLILYYLIIFVVILGLQRLGLVIGDQKHESIAHALGTVLVIFSFFIIFDWESCYINQTLLGHCDPDKVSSVYMASEDGVVYQFWSSRVATVEQARLLTFVVTPMILSLIGIALLGRDQVKLTPI